MAAHDFSIVAPEAELDWPYLQQEKRPVLAYLSVGEIAKDAPHRAAAIKAGVPFLGKNTVWDSDLVDVSSEVWHRFVLDHLAAKIAKQPFAGFFLDTAESPEYVAEKHPDRAKAMKEGLIQLVLALHEKFPNHLIVMNRGFAVWPEVAKAVDGMLIENVVRHYNLEKKVSRPATEQERDWIMERIGAVKAAGKPVFAVEFLAEDQLREAVAVVNELRGLGLVPLVCGAEFDGKVYGPLRIQPRRLLALFGESQALHGVMAMRWAADTNVGNFLQTPLEWMGYEVEYRNINQQELPDPTDERFAGILIDAGLELSPQKEMALVRWIGAEIQKGRKVLFVGGIPINSPKAMEELQRVLGLRIGPSPERAIPPGKLLVKDEKVMRGETPLVLPPFPYRLLVAPKEAQRFLSLEGRPGEPFDAVFAAPWGGVLPEPFIVLRRPDEVRLWLLDPFIFLEKVFGQFPGPVPDPNTRDGLRVFYSHIDGDGFGHRATSFAGKRAAEVVRDEILKRYGLPVSVSIIESELRGFTKVSQPGDAEELEAIAKTIYALPNVQPASHTFSHPFYWMSNDKTAVLYERQAVDLAGYEYGQMDLKREIEGSIRYIEGHLLPPERKVEMFLWSGNCRPGPEAIAMTQSLGVAAMNGGGNTITRASPSLTLVSPRVFQWDDVIQVLAANQNEMLYTNNWTSALRGTFINVLQSFDMTEMPRRLKPVNLYHHMFLAERLDGLQSLRSIYAWILKQPLHHTTARQYHDAILGSRAAEVFQDCGDGGWIVAGAGACRTLRLPSEGPSVDLAKSQNLLGYHRQPNGLFITTGAAGAAKVSLASSGDAVEQDGLYLRSSTAPIAWERADPRQMKGRVGGWVPVRLVLGARPGSEWVVERGDSQQKQTVQTGADGGLVLEGLPPGTTFEVQAK
jgi:hypothetical protein